jgi:hypothetical protein
MSAGLQAAGAGAQVQLPVVSKADSTHTCRGVKGEKVAVGCRWR